MTATRRAAAIVQPYEHALYVSRYGKVRLSKPVVCVILDVLCQGPEAEVIRFAYLLPLKPIIFLAVIKLLANSFAHNHGSVNGVYGQIATVK